MDIIRRVKVRRSLKLLVFEAYLHLLVLASDFPCTTTVLA
jgi:hypothetical protein